MIFHNSDHLTLMHMLLGILAFTTDITLFYCIISYIFIVNQQIDTVSLELLAINWQNANKKNKYEY